MTPDSAERPPVSEPGEGGMEGGREREEGMEGGKESVSYLE